MGGDTKGKPERGRVRPMGELNNATMQRGGDKHTEFGHKFVHIFQEKTRKELRREAKI